MNRALASLIFVVFIFGCSSQKKVANLTEWKGKVLQFGSGGGVTGVTNRYILLENGQIFLQTGIVNGSVKELKPVSARKAKKLFSSAAKIGWPAEKVTHPGNISTTVNYQDGTKEHEIVWGDLNYAPPTEVTSLYKELTAIVP